MARPKKKSANAAPEATDPIAQAAAGQILKRPHDRDMRIVSYEAVDRAVGESAEARREVAEAVNAAIKTVVQVNGVHKDAESFRRKLMAKDPAVRAHILLDLEQMAADYGWDAEVAFLRKLVATTEPPTEQTVFDTTPSGQRQVTSLTAEAAQRGKDDPAIPSEPSPGLPADEALARFQANQDKAPPVPPAPPSRAEGNFKIVHSA